MLQLLCGFNKNTNTYCNHPSHEASAHLNFRILGGFRQISTPLSSDERLKSKTSLFSRRCSGFQPGTGKAWRKWPLWEEWTRRERLRDIPYSFAIHKSDVSIRYNIIYTIDVCIRFYVCVWLCVSVALDHLLLC